MDFVGGKNKRPQNDGSQAFTCFCGEDESKVSYKQARNTLKINNYIV